MTTLRMIGRPERRVGVRERPLDEDEPAEGSDRGVGREDLPAAEAVGDHGRRGVCRGPARSARAAFTWARRGEIPLLAQQPTVGMGDEVVPRVHHVG